MRTSSLITFIALSALTSVAGAQDRNGTGRARLELGFDLGVGASSEGGYLELAPDFRIYSPPMDAHSVGVALRVGGAVQGFSNAFALDLGFAYRVDLFGGTIGGLQLSAVVGPSFAYGPFNAGDVPAFGGFSMIHLDIWHRNFFVGVGVSAHAMWATEAPPGAYAPNLRDGPIMTITPLIRIGGDWGI